MATPHKKCRKCGNEDQALFYPYRKTVCKPCHYAYQADYRRRQAGQSMTKDKKYALKKRYGLTVEEYEALLERQDSKCAICRIDPKLIDSARPWLHVDHDHLTGRVRGLLCNGCNRALGFVNDNPVVARAMASYLEAA